MKIHTLFIATHLAAGLAGVLAMTLAQWLGASHLQTTVILLGRQRADHFAWLFWLTGPLLRTLHCANEPLPPAMRLRSTPSGSGNWTRRWTAFVDSSRDGQKRPPTRGNSRAISIGCWISWTVAARSPDGVPAVDRSANTSDR